MKVAAIVLAAGFSRRMQQFKPLLPLGGETITDRLIHTFLQNGIEVVVVTGYRQDELRAGIKTQNVRMVENPDYLRGMFTSVQTGLRHLNHLNMDYEAVFIAPVDIPLLRPFTIRRLRVGNRIAI
jgi:CTP:molybdopterin cytidylyltransferase MocA